MTPTYDQRIARADELAATSPGARELLNCYRQLAVFQKSVFEELRSKAVTDLGILTCHFSSLIDLVERTGPPAVAEFGVRNLRSVEAQESLLLACWEGEDAGDGIERDTARFLARVLLEPYAEHLAARGKIEPDSAGATCPFCSARPVVGVLRTEGEGGKRSLICSLCATEWPYRRIVCPGCGEEQKDQLPVYIAADFDYVRVEACDTCKTYLKSVDLTRNGRAVPVVDELATVALDIWAEEHGYTKLELNVLGM
jgi:FdhE protein